MILVHIFTEKCGPCEIAIKRTRAYCTSDFGESIQSHYISITRLLVATWQLKDLSGVVDRRVVEFRQ